MSASTCRSRVARGIGFPALAAAVATLAILAGLAGPGDAASAREATTPGAAKQAPVITAATGPRTAVTKAVMAKWVLDKAGGAAAAQAVGMIFSAIGLNNLVNRDPNTALLNEIKAQLAQVSMQLAQAQATLDSLVVDVRQSDFDKKIIALREKSNRLRELLAGPFTRVVDAVADLEKLREGEHTPDQIQQAEKAVNDRRYEFLLAFDRCCDSMPADIHDYLVPGTANSVLASLGRLRLAEKRYLTSRDSAEIRAVYTLVAESEALASWLKMERFIPARPGTVPDGTFPGSINEFNRARREFLGYRLSEALHVPPMIPAGVVVDAGPGPRNGTSRAAMWLPTSRSLRFQPGVGGPGTVPRAIDDLVKRHAEGFDDWQIPSQSEVTALLGGFTGGGNETPNIFLSNLNFGSPAWRRIAEDSWPFIWSKGLAAQRVTCRALIGPGLPTWGTEVSTHVAVSTSTPTPVWSPRPQLSRWVDGMASDARVICERYFRDSFGSAAAAGGFIAQRDTGVMPIDFTAVGGGRNLRPGANLRNADLESFNLTGVDLTGADLTGATLTDALFCSEDACSPGATFTGAQLFGVKSGGIVGSALLPAPWQLSNGYLVGPGADLTGAKLAGDLRADPPVPPADLSGATLTAVVSGGVDCTGCKLPAGWRWTGLPTGYLVGPGANLAGADLSRLDLSGLNLAGADLSAASLKGTRLAGANLTGVEFDGADLSGANLTGANLTGANLSRLDLTGAVLSNATLKNANLSRATAAGADLTRADLSSANLQVADLTRSNLTRADLSGASISDTDLAHATLFGVSSRVRTQGYPAALPADWLVVRGHLLGPGADLRGASLADSDLTAWNLTDADFTGANLRNTLLTNAILVRVTLTAADITGATFSTDNDNKLAGIVSGGLVGAPRALPASGRFRVVQGYLIGPSANLAGATFTSAAQLGVSLSATNFTNATLTGVNLTSATLNNAIFSGARLTGVTLTGANMSNATLDGVVSGGIVAPTLPGRPGIPSLPAGWKVVDGYLVGPGANLSVANLSGANLPFQNLSAANLRGANLRGAFLGGANLEGANLTSADVTGARWAATTCPDGIRQNTPCAPVDWLGSSTVAVSAGAANGNGQLSITVGPGVGGATWRVTVQRLAESGGWVAVGIHTTRGPGDTLTINLPNGTYRAVVPPQNRYVGSLSREVVLAT
jgi:uncharacterized protein YjbI with pentapeptide repeats